MPARCDASPDTTVADRSGPARQRLRIQPIEILIVFMVLRPTGLLGKVQLQKV